MSEGTPHDSENPPQDVPDETIEAFAERLEGFAATLTARDRRLLEVVIARAAPPHVRMGWRNPEDVLDADERATLERLERAE